MYFPDDIWNEIKKCIFKTNEMKKYDIIVISTGHSLYRENTFLINNFIKMDSVLIYDTIGVFSDNEINQITENQKLIILGRGNL